MAMKGDKDSRVYEKAGIKVRSFCLREVVEGLSVEGSYSRMLSWEKGPFYKDLDWLFRPLGYTKNQCRKILGKDDSHVFSKGLESVTADCIMETVGITRPGAFLRCHKWVDTDFDLDWLFRPCAANKDTSRFKKQKPPKSRYTEDHYKAEDATYEMMLRKHWGIEVVV